MQGILKQSTRLQIADLHAGTPMKTSFGPQIATCTKAEAAKPARMFGRHPVFGPMELPMIFDRLLN